MRYAVVVRTGPAQAEHMPSHDGVAVPGGIPDEPVRACTETTRAGRPCQGTAGSDGLCAAHKPKGGDGGATVDADQAQGDG